MISSLTLSAAIPLLLWPTVDRHLARIEAADALASLSRCLHGAAPPSDTLFRARRLAQAARDGLAEPTADAWPHRCVAYANRAAAALRRADRDAQRCERRCCAGDQACLHGERLQVLLELVVEGLSTAEIAAGTWAAIAEQTAALELSNGHPAAVAAPPPPAELLTPGALHPLVEGPVKSTLVDPVGGERLPLLFHQPEQRYRLCELHLPAAELATCRTLPAALPVRAAGRLLGASEGAPWLLLVPAAEGESPAVHDLTHGQERLRLEGAPGGGIAWPEAFAAVTAHEQGYALLRRPLSPVDAPVTRLELDIDPASSPGPDMVHDTLVWTVRDPDRALRLHTAAVRPDGSIEPPQDHGHTGPLEGLTRLEACRTPSVLAVVLSEEPHGGAQNVTLAFRTEGVWQPLVRHRVLSSWFGLTCHERSARLSWTHSVEEGPSEPRSFGVRGRYRVHRTTCDASGCLDDAAEVVLARRSGVSRYVIGDLGEAMLLLYRSSLGDVRLRVAPLGGLPEAVDRPLFDDEDHDGLGWDLDHGTLFLRAGVGVLLLSRGEGTRRQTFAVRLDAQGGVRPIAARDEVGPP